MKPVATHTVSEEAIQALVSQHELFRRFLVGLTGSAADADDILQESLLRALQRSGTLKRKDRLVPWFYRVLRNAVTDYYRSRRSQKRRIEGLLNDLVGTGDDTVPSPSADWDAAVCRCFEGLLPVLNPRYAELLRRIDLEGEGKASVRKNLRLSSAAFDVALHRARQALRKQLEVFCGSCSRDACLACMCKPPAPTRKS